MVHNHELLLEDKVHKLRSYKKIEKAHVDFFSKDEKKLYESFTCLSVSKQ